MWAQGQVKSIEHQPKSKAGAAKAGDRGKDHPWESFNSQLKTSNSTLGQSGSKSWDGVPKELFSKTGAEKHQPERQTVKMIIPGRRPLHEHSVMRTEKEKQGQVGSRTSNHLIKTPSVNTAGRSKPPSRSRHKVNTQIQAAPARSYTNSTPAMLKRWIPWETWNDFFISKLIELLSIEFRRD